MAEQREDETKQPKATKPNQVEKGRDEVGREYREAQNPAEAGSKLRKIFMDARDHMNRIKSTFGTETYSKQPDDVKKEEKKKIMFDIGRFFDSLRILRREAVSPKTLGISPLALDMLLAIDDKVGNAISNDSVEPYFVFLSQLAEKEPRRGDVKNAWAALIRDIPSDLSLLRNISEVLIDSARRRLFVEYIKDEDARLEFAVPRDTLGSETQSTLSKSDKARLTDLQSQINEDLNSSRYSVQEQLVRKQRYLDALRNRDAAELVALFSSIFPRVSDAMDFIRLSEREQNDQSEESLISILANYGVKREEIRFVLKSFILANIDAYIENGRVNPKKKEEMRESTFKAINGILSRVSDNLDREWRDSFNPQIEGRYAKDLAGLINRMLTDSSLEQAIKLRDPTGEAYTDFQNVIRNLTSFVTEEQDRRQLAHSIMYNLANNKLENAEMLKVVQDFNVSKANSMLSGYQGAVVDLASSFVPEYLAFTTAVKNNNQFSPDIWSAKPHAEKERYFPDFEAMRNAFKMTMAQIADDPETPEAVRDQFKRSDDASVNRAISLGVLLSYSTQRAANECALIEAPQEYKPTPLIEDINPKLKYDFLKAHELKLNDPSYVPELRGNGLRIKISNRFGKTFIDRAFRSGGGWVPKNFEAQKHVTRKAILQSLIKDDKGKDHNDYLKPIASIATYNDSITLSEGYGDMGFYDVFSRGGERITGLKRWLEEEWDKEQEKKPKAERKSWGTDMDEFYLFVQRRAGASARWFYDSDRADTDATRLANLRLAKEKKGLTKMQENNLRELITQEIKMERVTTLRGSNFQALLERSPENFLFTFSRLEPELAQMVETSHGTMSAYEFYFDEAKKGELSPEEIRKRTAQRNVWKARWTDAAEYVNDTADKDFSNYANYQHLKRIAKLWHDVYYRYATEQGDAGEKKLSAKKSTQAQTILFERMSSATRRVMVKDQLVMKATDIINTALPGGDEDGKFFARLFLDENNGLVTYFKNQHENFGDDPSTSDKKFFYWVANRWFNHDFRGDVLPTQSDMKLTAALTRAREGWGDNLFLDSYNHMRMFNEAVNALGNIDQVVLIAAREKKMEPIYELHQKIHALRGFLGPGVQKYHFMIATAVVRFYQQDYRARIPYPFNLFSGYNLGKDISRSVSRKSWGAMMFTEEQIREYGTFLLSKEYLAGGGLWSRDMLWNEVGADRKKFMYLQALPSIVSMSVFGYVYGTVTSALQQYGGGMFGGKSKSTA